MMQYGHKGPEARESFRLFIGTSDCHFAEPTGLLRPVSADSSESSHTPDDPADIFSRGLSLEAYHHLVHALQPAPKPHSTA